MSPVDRRTLLKTAAAASGWAAASSAARGLASTDVTRAVRTALRDQDRWHCGHYLFLAGCLGPWARARAEGGDTPLEIALDICEHDPLRTEASSALGLAFELMGYVRCSDDVLFHYVPGLVSGPRCASPSERDPALERRLWQIALTHECGSGRALCRQALGDLAPDDLLCTLAFQAAGEADLLDVLPRRGPPSAELRLTLFRRSIESNERPRAGAVGAALLRDRRCVGRLVERRSLLSYSSSSYAEVLSAHACPAVLDFPRQLFPLRRLAFHPRHELPGPHYALGGSAHCIERFDETLFPFECSDMHKALQPLTEAELRPGLQDNRRECRIETAMELAHRWRGRELAQLAGPFLRVAEPCDAVRLLRVVMDADPGLAAEMAPPLLGHPDWEMRLAAAGALLRVA